MILESELSAFHGGGLGSLKALGLCKGVGGAAGVRAFVSTVSLQFRQLSLGCRTQVSACQRAVMKNAGE